MTVREVLLEAIMNDAITIRCDNPDEYMELMAESIPPGYTPRCPHCLFTYRCGLDTILSDIEDDICVDNTCTKCFIQVMDTEAPEKLLELRREWMEGVA